MTNLKQEFAELLSLTRLHLLQDFSRDEWLTTDPETFTIFKQHALQQKKNVQPKQIPQPPTVKQYAPPPPPIASPQQPKPIPSSAPLLPPKAKLGPKPLPSLTNIQSAPPEKKPPTKDTSAFALEKMPLPSPVDFTDVQKIIREKLPNIQVVDEIPNDSEAKRISNSWQQASSIPSVLVITFNESAKEITFLQNLTNAINDRLAPATLMSTQHVEVTFGWEKMLNSKELRLIIASTHGLNAHTELMKEYREVQKQAKFFLRKVPLCLLSDISLYLKEPKLKIPLWNSVMAELSIHK